MSSASFLCNSSDFGASPAWHPHGPTLPIDLVVWPYWDHLPPTHSSPQQLLLVRNQTLSHLAWKTADTTFYLLSFLSKTLETCQLSEYLSQNSLWDLNFTVEAWNAIQPEQQRRHKPSKSQQANFIPVTSVRAIFSTLSVIQGCYFANNKAVDTASCGVETTAFSVCFALFIFQDSQLSILSFMCVLLYV